MEFVHAVKDRIQFVLLGMLVSAIAYGVLHSLLDEYVTPLAGAVGVYAGILYARRGGSGSLQAGQVDDAYAWGLGTLLGVFLLAVTRNGLLLIGWNFFWQQVGIGVLVFLVLALSFGLNRRHE